MRSGTTDWPEPRSQIDASSQRRFDECIELCRRAIVANEAVEKWESVALSYITIAGAQCAHLKLADAKATLERAIAFCGVSIQTDRAD